MLRLRDVLLTFSFSSERLVSDPALRGRIVFFAVDCSALLDGVRA